MAALRPLQFARLRVPAFTAVASAACALLTLFAGACSDRDDAASTVPFDAAPPPPPGACSAARSATKLCETSHSPEPVDAGNVPERDAGADGSGEAPVTLAPPESANLCLVTDDISIICPSRVSAIAVAEGANDTTDVVIAQVGMGRYASPTDPTLVADDLAHVQHLRIGTDGDATTAMAPIAPYPAAEIVQGGAFALLGATDARDAQMLAFTKDGDGAQTLRAGALVPSPVALGAPLAIPASVAWQPHVVTGPGGEGVLFAIPRGGPPYHTPAGPLVVVRGLPDAPRVVTTSVTSSSAMRFGATLTPSGVPAVLFNDGTTLRLREGDDLANERWSQPLEQNAEEFFDVAYSGDEPVILYRSSTGFEVRGARVETAPSHLGESFSTCPRSTYVGLTCDECPVDRSCYVGKDAITQAKLFTRGDRVFAAFVAIDQRRRMGYARTTVPIIDVGCVCSLEEREVQVVGQSLVVVEITPSTDRFPVITEWMRVPLFETNRNGYAWFYPRQDGDLDVVFGDFPARHDEAVPMYREARVTYRLLRLATRLIP